MKNFPITVESGDLAGKTYWISRAVAVTGFVFCKINGEWSVLANQRGEGTPDFQGYWNCPCGYLDFDETSAKACVREIYEETGVTVDSKSVYFIGCNDDPVDSNLQNVTMRFLAIMDSEVDNIGTSTGPIKGNLGGEVDEVQSIQWIKVSEIENYQWAFNHKRLIRGIYDYYIVDNNLPNKLPVL